MSARDDGGPAFPVPIRDFGPDFLTGMTLRDWFAGMALTGLLTSREKRATTLHADDAAYCYAIADAMIAERAK